MKIINKSQFTELCTARMATCHPRLFLDDFKIGLHLDPIVSEMPAEIDFQSDIKLENLPKKDLRKSALEPDRFYLGFSREHLSLPSDVIGFLHTRSSLARFGLDLFGSSSYVSPGFGAEKPTRIVFEISSRTRLLNLPLDKPVAGMVLYHISSESTVWRGKGRHFMRFPFIDHKAGNLG